MTIINKISYKKEYINKLFNMRIMKYFYNNTEIDNFINQCRMKNNDIR